MEYFYWKINSISPPGVSQSLINRILYIFGDAESIYDTGRTKFSSEYLLQDLHIHLHVLHELWRCSYPKSTILPCLHNLVLHSHTHRLLSWWCVGSKDLRHWLVNFYLSFIHFYCYYIFWKPLCCDIIWLLHQTTPTSVICHKFDDLYKH